jgi:phosphoribosyl 1,2-cyclic phosphate phosphodiesterase
MKVKFTLLGTGSSMGVPRPDGFFGKCDPNNKKNYRTRCSALISFNKMNILIDTSPDLRHQLLSNNITTIDNVLYTHFNADQTHGFNVLSVFYLKKKKKLIFIVISSQPNIFLKILHIVLLRAMTIQQF